jgi:glycosyltransferase involved in cell wall biosynthesis
MTYFMNPTLPTISVIIPLYNGARFIVQALDSVFAQNIQALEVIVVDDGSTDGGPDIVSRYAATHDLTLLRKPNGGQSSARNLGIRHSHGELIALLDQDDVWYPDHLEELAQPFAEDPHKMLGWAYSNLDEITEDSRLRVRAALSVSDIHPKMELGKCLAEDMFILPSSSMISRAAFDAVGGFDEELCGYEDDDLFVRLFAAGYRNVYVEKPLAQWRVYSGSTSYTPRMAQSRMLYARKLLRSFPDQPSLSRYYARDLIAPRFLRQVVDETRVALGLGDTEIIDSCLADIAFLEGYLAPANDVFPVRKELLITAVIPLYNGEAFIEEALRSVLSQELLPDELIVVDDGSTDSGPAIVAEMAKQYPIRLLRKENGGQSSARNLGVAHAHGDLIAFLDQDDVWYPNHLAELIKPFQESRAVELGWSYSNMDEINEAGEMMTHDFLVSIAYLDSPHPKSDLTSCLRQDMFVLPSASLVSRKAFRSVGGFDERLSGYEDDDLFLRIFLAGFANVYIATPLSKWRLYKASSSYSPRMARSRMVYARKLLHSFPDDPSFSRFHARDFIAPRFVRQAVEATRVALRLGDTDEIDACLADVAFLEGYLAPANEVFPVRKELLITAIIPLYNGAPFIEEALRSIFNQELVPDEIIVVDDGSTDTGPAIVAEMAKQYPIRLLHKENGGQSSARNLGVDHAHGDLIAFLDQDDAWYPNHLVELIKPFLESRSVELGWAYSDMDEINEAGEMMTHNFLVSIAYLNSPHPKRDLASCLRQDMFVLPSASLISREAFRRVGGFDERLSGYEDDDLFLRMFLAGYANVFIPAPLSKWRIYQASSSYSQRMAVSRAIYARKLIARFPNDLVADRYHVRDYIAPRFFRTMTGEFRKATLRGTKEQQATALANLHYVTRHLRFSQRVPLQFFFLPILHIPPVAHFVMKHRFILFRILRRFYQG